MSRTVTGTEKKDLCTELKERSKCVLSFIDHLRKQTGFPAATEWPVWYLARVNEFLLTLFTLVSIENKVTEGDMLQWWK